MNIIFNSLLVQLVKYKVHTTRKIKSIHAIFIIIVCVMCNAWKTPAVQKKALHGDSKANGTT